jgi:hypothetical protein
MAFQRRHLPHRPQSPHPSLPRLRGRVREGATRRRPQWRQGGIEEQTRKLFEVCRLRDVPIITFANKLDREGRDPFDLLDEIEQSPALDVTPAFWPIGMGRDFLGAYDLFADALLLFERGAHDPVTEPVRCSGLDDPKLPRRLPKAALVKLPEVEMAKGLCPPLLALRALIAFSNPGVGLRIVGVNSWCAVPECRTSFRAKSRSVARR